MTAPAGKLYVIATPIGNLDDITLRAVKTLREDVAGVYCEDTRQSRKLLNHLGISLPAWPLHSNSPEGHYARAVEFLREGNSAAYLTDSGTPGVSDPGSALVRACREAEIEIVPIPGPSALTALLSISGFPGRDILFMGFLSRKPGKRRKELESLRGGASVGIIYESPARVRKLLLEIVEFLPEAHIVIGRELTKLHEEIIAGSIADICARIDTVREQGEFAIALYLPERKNPRKGKYDEGEDEGDE
ncbi:MAG: 16S rRNA (cytidine(1402)-2'-O)-methyltransferase [Spirochaetes bacterium]|nr:16S rRNA (cytidine(1402)-2'-O)-methyltransferase [Spirochaetota bacterium]